MEDIVAIERRVGIFSGLMGSLDPPLRRISRLKPTPIEYTSVYGCMGNSRLQFFRFANWGIIPTSLVSEGRQDGLELILYH